MSGTNEWITGRAPTQDDADLHGDIQVKVSPYFDVAATYHWSQVDPSQLWRHTRYWNPQQADRIAALERKVAKHISAQSVIVAALVKRLEALEGLASDGAIPESGRGVPEGGIVTLEQRMTDAFGIAAFQIKKPVSLSEEKPGPDDVDARGRCLYGFWNKEEDAWEFGLQDCPYDEDTHWLPVSSDVTPHKLFRP